MIHLINTLVIRLYSATVTFGSWLAMTGGAEVTRMSFGEHSLATISMCLHKGIPGLVRHLDTLINLENAYTQLLGPFLV